MPCRTTAMTLDLGACLRWCRGLRRLRDLEFVQFHPTAIASGLDPMPSATEAGRRRLARQRARRALHARNPGAELAPRDMVARAVFAQITAGEQVFLDSRPALGERLPRHFPAVAALCRAAGIDPLREPIPVRPAAHYHMGGVKVDGCGRSTLEGLRACGEVSSTGLHGANRLASNSLPEALATARWTAEDILAADRRARPAKHRPPLVQETASAYGAADGVKSHVEVREVTDRCVGVLRDAAGLAQALRGLGLAASGSDVPAELRDAATVGLLIAAAAYARRESRGAHQRQDYSIAEPVGRHSETTLESAWRLVSEIDGRVARPPLRRVA